MLDQLYVCYMEVKRGVQEKHEVAISIKSTKSYGKSNVPCKVDGQEEYREADVGIEESNR